MSKLDILKPLAAKTPELLKKAGKFIDAHGDGDGNLELSDVVDTLKDGAEAVADFFSDLF